MQGLLGQAVFVEACQQHQTIVGKQSTAQQATWGLMFVHLPERTLHGALEHRPVHGKLQPQRQLPPSPFELQNACPWQLQAQQRLLPMRWRHTQMATELGNGCRARIHAHASRAPHSSASSSSMAWSMANCQIVSRCSRCASSVNTCTGSRRKIRCNSRRHWMRCACGPSGIATSRRWMSCTVVQRLSISARRSPTKSEGPYATGLSGELAEQRDSVAFQFLERLHQLHVADHLLQPVAVQARGRTIDMAGQTIEHELRNIGDGGIAKACTQLIPGMPEPAIVAQEVAVHAAQRPHVGHPLGLRRLGQRTDLDAQFDRLAVALHQGCQGLVQLAGQTMRIARRAQRVTRIRQRQVAMTGLSGKSIQARVQLTRGQLGMLAQPGHQFIQ
ncbi:hypothetical protein WR25_16518 [Diploscapter pachys]|uniref:Uncharacterized protein n=1 Tax=Diploscapter pachys TaxID=2018661 RepID=A0A2A2KJ62_9BILA|nr:hypothetical protein WR25_16518 [Diploscapter pachys]